MLFALCKFDIYIFLKYIYLIMSFYHICTPRHLARLHGPRGHNYYQYHTVRVFLTIAIENNVTLLAC